MRDTGAMTATWTTRPATPADLEWMLPLRLEVLRPHLERVGVWNPDRARERFTGEYRPENTTVVLVQGEPSGLFAVRPEPGALWLEHFYLAAATQNLGIGSAILRDVLRDRGDLPVYLNVLVGSPATRLYERWGFTLERADEVDAFMVAR